MDGALEVTSMKPMKQGRSLYAYWCDPQIAPQPNNGGGGGFASIINLSMLTLVAAGSFFIVL